MKRFSFRLDRLLHLREIAEREQARALAVALGEEEACRAAVRQSEARLGQAREQFATLPRDLSQAGTLRNLDLTIAVLMEQTDQLSREHEASLERVEVARHGFEKARMARRVIERLKEHRQLAWDADVSRLEQSELDETAIQRAQAGQGGTR
ncbi:MAG TPA: hypothetical protein VMG41_09795 [Gemmatimonadales bacterium]|nr:hypothetical protein [Gemmatimonadales bacterium]